MKRILILGAISIGLVLSSCNTSNRVVSNFYEDGIYYNPAIGNMPTGSLASNERDQNNQATAVDDYFDPNYKSQGQTIVNNNFYGGFNPMWGAGFGPGWGMGMGFHPMWMRPGLSFGFGWGMGWNRWGMGWGPSWAYNPWMWDPWMMNRMWMWDPWMMHHPMMWDPFWGHPMAWGNPWMNPWHPGFGWGPGWISNQPPRAVTPVRGIRSGSYASTGSGVGRKSVQTDMPSNRTSQMRNSREVIATESALPTARLGQGGLAEENPVSRLRASDLRTARDMASSASTAQQPALSRGGNNYAERLNANALQADRIQRGSVQQGGAMTRQSATPLQRGQASSPTYTTPMSRGSQTTAPATREYRTGQMESIQARPIQRQNTWNQSAPASRQSMPSNSGGARQFNSSPSFNSSGGGAVRGGGTSGGRLR